MLGVRAGVRANLQFARTEYKHFQCAFIGLKNYCVLGIWVFGHVGRSGKFR